MIPFISNYVFVGVHKVCIKKCSNRMVIKMAVGGYLIGGDYRLFIILRIFFFVLQTMCFIAVLKKSMCDLYNQKQQHGCFCCVENSLLTELFLEVTQRGIRNFTLVKS